jgi:hypothetical protein
MLIFLFDTKVCLICFIILNKTKKAAENRAAFE